MLRINVERALGRQHSYQSFPNLKEENMLVNGKSLRLQYQLELLTCV